ncbi:hypothetical protein [Jatrophihabitans sp.]|uniref:hypothetical protein n=1 Tax=Jatrophihabitans sp. TaxID=1932789 RepID=UPI0030C69B5C|nr:hypothetical protein [Jatrophihabitans sp.]
MQVTVWPRGKTRTVVSGPLGVDWGAVPKAGTTPLPMSKLGELLSVQASTRYEPGFGGHDLASWTINPFGGYAGGIVRPGDHVRIVAGGSTVYEGEFSEATPGDDGTVTFHARGYAYNLFDYPSIKWIPLVGPDTFYPTTNLADGWDYATTELGMPISQIAGPILMGVGALPTGSYGAAPIETFNMLGTLLTAMQQEIGERWAVWGRTLVLGPDATVPTWRYPSPDAVVAVADTEYATDVYLWYQATASAFVAWSAATAYVIGDLVTKDARSWRAIAAGTNHTPAEGAWWTELPVTIPLDWYAMAIATDAEGLQRFDRRVEGTDYRSLGLMTSTRAGTIAQQLLDQVKGRFVFTGGFTVGPESGFQSAAGGKAQLAFVRAGQMCDMPGLRTSQGNLMPGGSTSFIIGQTTYDWSVDGTESLQITPMGAVARSLSQILSAPSQPDAGTQVAAA